MEISFNHLEKAGIDIDMYCLLNTLYVNDRREINYIMSKIDGDYLEETLPILEELDYIKITGDKIPEDIVVRSKFIDILRGEVKVDFDEIWLAYPDNVIGSGGETRQLRAKYKMFANALTNDYKVCKKKYLVKIRDIDTHQKIVELLKADVINRESNNTLRYMKELVTWINSSAWEKCSTHGAEDDKFEEMI